ncbi:MAG TPA: response regulator [Candidatus Saccharimonadales bacterium]|nr:response regulator [Candidatus Saccharimonadales bacterium]
MRVLLVEPDKIQARLTVEALVRGGHTVDHAVSAQSAVHTADEHMPDVVVLELQLARHNGVEFLYEFRSYPEWLHVPVIAYTFVPPRELQQAATLHEELGVVRILHKPATSLAHLCQVVQTVAASSAKP